MADELAELDPWAAEYEKGKQLYAEEDYAGALAVFRGIIVKSPEYRNAPNYVDLCKEALGEKSVDISAEFAAARALDPDQFDWTKGTLDERYESGKSLYEAQKYAKALPIFESILQEQAEYRNAQFYADSCKQELGNAAGDESLDGRYEKGKGLYEQQSYAAALEVFQAVVQESPEYRNSQFYIDSCKNELGASGSAETIDNRYEAGKALYEAQKYSEALVLFQQILKESPNYRNSQFYVDSCLQELGGEAQGTLDERYEKGKALYEAANYAEALSIFQGIVAESPEYRNSQFYVESCAQASGGDAQEGIDERYQKAKTHYEAEKYIEALSIFQGILKEQSEYRNAPLYVDSCAQMLAAARAGESIEERYDRGKALYEEGNYLVALKVFSAILEEQADYRNAPFYVSSCEDALGKQAESMDERYDKAEALYSDGKYLDAFLLFRTILDEAGGEYRQAAARAASCKEELDKEDGDDESEVGARRPTAPEIVLTTVELRDNKPVMSPRQDPRRLVIPGAEAADEDDDNDGEAVESGAASATLQTVATTKAPSFVDTETGKSERKVTSAVAQEALHELVLSETDHLPITALRRALERRYSSVLRAFEQPGMFPGREVSISELEAFFARDLGVGSGQAFAKEVLRRADASSEDRQRAISTGKVRYAPSIGMHSADRPVVDPQNGRQYFQGLDARTWEYRGKARYARGDYSGAVECFTAALRMEPGNAELVVRLGASLLAMGDAEGALVQSSQALANDPDNVQAFTMRAAARRQLGDFDGCIDDCGKALQIDSENDQALVHRSAAWCAVGRHAKAIEDCNAALKINPSSAQALVHRAVAKCAMENYVGSARDCTKALELSPNNRSAQANLVVARRMMGIDDQVGDPFVDGMLQPGYIRMPGSVCDCCGLESGRCSNLTFALSDMESARDSPSVARSGSPATASAFPWRKDRPNQGSPSSSPRLRKASPAPSPHGRRTAARCEFAASHALEDELEAAISESPSAIQALRRALDSGEDSAAFDGYEIAAARRYDAPKPTRFGNLASPQRESPAQRMKPVSAHLRQAAADLEARGLRYYNIGDLNAAIASFTAALELEPMNSHCHAGRSLAYLAEGDYSRAMTDSAVALSIDPMSRCARVAMSAAQQRSAQQTPTRSEVKRPLRNSNRQSRQERLGRPSTGKGAGKSARSQTPPKRPANGERPPDSGRRGELPGQGQKFASSPGNATGDQQRQCQPRAQQGDVACQRDKPRIPPTDMRIHADKELQRMRSAIDDLKRLRGEASRSARQRALDDEGIQRLREIVLEALGCRSLDADAAVKKLAAGMRVMGAQITVVDFHTTLRKTGLPPSMLSDIDIDTMFELFDTNASGYISGENVAMWLESGVALETSVPTEGGEPSKDKHSFGLPRGPPEPSSMAGRADAWTKVVGQARVASNAASLAVVSKDGLGANLDSRYRLAGAGLVQLGPTTQGNVSRSPKQIAQISDSLAGSSLDAAQQRERRDVLTQLFDALDPEKWGCIDHAKIMRLAKLTRMMAAPDESEDANFCISVWYGIATSAKGRAMIADVVDYMERVLPKDKDRFRFFVRRFLNVAHESNFTALRGDGRDESREQLIDPRIRARMAMCCKVSMGNKPLDKVVAQLDLQRTGRFGVHDFMYVCRDILRVSAKDVSNEELSQVYDALVDANVGAVYVEDLLNFLGVEELMKFAPAAPLWRRIGDDRPPSDPFAPLPETSRAAWAAAVEQARFASDIASVTSLANGVEERMLAAKERLSPTRGQGGSPVPWRPAGNHKPSGGHACGVLSHGPVETVEVSIDLGVLKQHRIRAPSESVQELDSAIPSEYNCRPPWRLWSPTKKEGPPEPGMPRALRPSQQPVKKVRMGDSRRGSQSTVKSEWWNDSTAGNPYTSEAQTEENGAGDDEQEEQEVNEEEMVVEQEEDGEEIELQLEEGVSERHTEPEQLEPWTTEQTTEADDKRGESMPSTIQQFINARNDDRSQFDWGNQDHVSEAMDEAEEHGSEGHDFEQEEAAEDGGENYEIDED